MSIAEEISHIPMPFAMAARPRDVRGYPIPYFQFIPDSYAKDRKVDFTVTDPQRRMECLTRRLCGLCGVKILANVFFIGGPLSFESRIYSDPAMHGPCAEYAIKICPFLRNVNYSVIDTEVRHKKQAVVQDALACAERPPKMCLVVARTYQLARIRDGKTGEVHPMYYSQAIEAKLVREF